MGIFVTDVKFLTLRAVLPQAQWLVSASPLWWWGRTLGLLTAEAPSHGVPTRSVAPKFQMAAGSHCPKTPPSSIHLAPHTSRFHGPGSCGPEGIWGERERKRRGEHARNFYHSVLLELAYFIITLNLLLRLVYELSFMLGMCRKKLFLGFSITHGFTHPRGSRTAPRTDGQGRLRQGQACFVGLAW